MEILSCCETKVLDTMGDLNVNEHVLAECDVVFNVFHRPFLQQQERIPKRAQRDVRNPTANIWRHPMLFAMRKMGDPHNVLDLLRHDGYGKNGIE